MAALSTQQYAAILKGIGAPVTAQNIRAFQAWQRAEGGSARFNPFNTTQPMSGASSYNSIGVRNYSSASQGIRATIETLKNGHYGNVLTALRRGNNAGKVAAAVGASPWGTSGQLFADILGSKLPAAPVPKGGGNRPKQPGSQIDPNQFKNAAASILLQNSIALAQPKVPGQPVAPAVPILTQLVAAKKASIAKAGTDMIKLAGKPLPSGPGGKGQRLVDLAAKQIGQPYVWGGESRKEGGFDCSGLVAWAAKHMGLNLPRTTSGLITSGRRVSMGQLRPGDLIVNNHHVVIYAGNNRVVAAPHTGTNVQYQPLSYFTGGDYQARRVV